MSSAPERALRVYRHLRSLLVLSVASDQFLDHYNDYAYRRLGRFQSGAFPGLTHWERAAVERHFPSPPARLLVGGVGAGREAFALEDAGYAVTAFDPSPSLLGGMSGAISTGSRIELFSGAYEDLPCLRPRGADGPPVDLRLRRPFAGGILGYGSYSHLRTAAARAGALRTFGELVRGPILISFIGIRATGPEHWFYGALRRCFPGRRARDPGNQFSLELGFHRLTTEAEFRNDCEEAGMELLEARFAPERHSNPHAVVALRS